MNPTAKQLIEAATRLRERHGEWRYVEGDSSYFKDVIASCDHILATVRPDDDEPVTRGNMTTEPDWRCVELLHDRQEYLHRQGINILCDNGEFRFRGFPLKSMGHLRRLVAALGE